MVVFCSFNLWFLDWILFFSWIIDNLKSSWIGTSSLNFFGLMMKREFFETSHENILWSPWAVDHSSVSSYCLAIQILV